MSSTALLCYGQVAMRAGKQVLPWVDNITSRMVYYFCCSKHVSPARPWQGGSCGDVYIVYCACVCALEAEPANPSNVQSSCPTPCPSGGCTDGALESRAWWGVSSENGSRGRV